MKSLNSIGISNAVCLMFMAVIAGVANENLLAGEASKPNVVIIVADDMGWGDVSFNGNGNLATPHLDRLASSGIIFNRFYVQPVCSPSRAEILTGRFAVRGGVHSTSQGGERLDLDEKTIGDVFKAAGYRTGFFGKWHNGSQYPYHPNGRGFDQFYGFCAGHWGSYINPLLEENNELVRGDGFLPNDLTERAMRFLDRTRPQPFLLFLSLNTPHSPMQMPDSVWERFDNKPLKFRGDGRREEKIEHTRAALAFCENIDWNVGRLYEKLDSLGVSKNTILLFLSDNGPNGARWNGGMKGMKGTLDEGGVRVPAFLHWPKEIEASQVSEQLAAGVDILPTLSDLAGLTIENSNKLDGISLKQCISKPEFNQERLIYNYWRNRVSVRDRQFRLSDSNQLFDLLLDPMQTTDVSAKYPDDLKRLNIEKERWVREVATELPKSDERRFPVGHPDVSSTILPARDAVFSGNIKRSNRWPNCSFLTNWRSTNDEITWPVTVLESGIFEPTIYYTCSNDDVGGTVVLSFQQSSVAQKLTTPFESVLFGKAYDRFPREESYTKEFGQLTMETVRFEAGDGALTLKAKEVPGISLMDFRRLVLRRIK